jgi:phage/plasmid-associated DNA primase
MSEAGGRTPLNTEMLKRLTGGSGAIAANAKYMREIQFSFMAKVLMLCNQLPVLIDTSGGLPRRLVCYLMNVKYVKDELYEQYSQEDKDAGLVYRQDPKFVAGLKKNKKGWIKWLIEGALAFMANKTRAAPSSVLEYSREALAASDEFSSWLNSNLLVSGNKEDEVPMKDISAEFIKDKGRNPADGKAKAELACRLLRKPRVASSGNAAKGRLIIQGVRWNVGCNPAMDEEQQGLQEEAYRTFLREGGYQSGTDELAIEFLSAC